MCPEPFRGQTASRLEQKDTAKHPAFQRFVFTSSSPNVILGQDLAEGTLSTSAHLSHLARPIPATFTEWLSLSKIPLVMHFLHRCAGFSF